MASRPRGYGMSAQAARKLAEKYDSQQEEEARVWIEAVLGDKVFGDAQGPEEVQRVLKDGKILARLAIALGAKIKVNEQNMPFKQMENISNFLKHADDLGVASSDLFQTADLYDNQNMGAVVSCIHAVGRKSNSKGLPVPQLGPKEAEANPREFTEEQLRASEGFIGAQAGPGKDQVASQAGDHYGRGRQITDSYK
ncbi:muscle-specific protein 20 isoform X2 [Exaiptasia diaphana]|uniref:Calponin-homology (CH) domain-containing protein n=1 Tax=Exaiptasia diaphana TaxID=2652724 RepID=A0A913WXL0_EXADI|nr:muscle-specific protein 20 isoform X2 [Exaiptasia diaphana]KXJ17071.1 Myophilin [Exaiptasia diaphana]